VDEISRQMKEVDEISNEVDEVSKEVDEVSKEVDEISRQTNEKVDECPLCKQVLPLKRMVNHVKKPHPHECGLNCKLKFVDPLDRAHHFLVDHNSPALVEGDGFLYCGECFDVFKDTQKSQHDIHVKHGKHLVCPKDKRAFPSANKISYEFHIKQNHSLQCHHCELAFLPANRLLFDKHKDTHKMDKVPEVKKKEMEEVILAQDQRLVPGHVEARSKALEGVLSLGINTTRPRLVKDQVDRGDVREKIVQKSLTKNRESEEIILLQDRRRRGHLEARFKALKGMSQVIDEVKALEEENRDEKDLKKMREEEIEEIKLLWNQRCLRNFKAMSKSLDQLRNTPNEVGSARQYQAGNVAENVIVISSDEDDETQQAHQESKIRERNELEEEISALSLDLECPVCLIVCAPPIYSCLAQHPVCSECRKDLKQCRLQRTLRPRHDSPQV